VAEERKATTRKSPADHVTELREMVVGYAKQEMIDPVVALKRYVGWGSAGSLFVGTGCAILLLGILRGLQTIDFLNEPGEPHGGTWSWLPYVITLAVAAVMIALSLWRAKKAYDRSAARQEHAR
jgi:heme exporter protein D